MRFQGPIAGFSSGEVVTIDEVQEIEEKLKAAELRIKDLTSTVGEGLRIGLSQVDRLHKADTIIMAQTEKLRDAKQFLATMCGEDNVDSMSFYEALRGAGETWQMVTKGRGTMSPEEEEEHVEEW